MVEDSMTLGEARVETLNSEVMDPILGLIKIHRQVRVRFMYRPENSEFSDDTTVGVFKAHAKVGDAYIIIDDGEGGVKQPKKLEPV